MRLRIDFGTHGARKEISWWQSLDDFPKIFSYAGKKYEWFMYDKDASGQVDWVLLYTQMPTYDPNYYADMPSWESLFGDREDKCECGAIYTSFPQIHLFYCKKWTKI